MRWSLFFLGVLALDFVSKMLVNASLPLMQWGSSFPHGGISIFNHFLGVSCAFVHTTNTGIAWGLFPSIPYLFVVLRFLAAAFLVWKAIKEPARRISFLLIAAGALGNAIDAFRYGHVVDMILLNFGSYTYPVFNLADSAICIGVGLLIFKTIFSHKKVSAEVL